MNKLVDQYLDTHDLEPLPVYHPLDDPLDAVIDLDARVTQLEDNLRRMALNNLTILQRMTTLAHDLKALTSDQSTSQQQSAIIMPDRFN